MVELNSFELDYIVNEDIPLIDLTSLVLSLEGDGNISFIFREDGIVCGTEEVERVFNRFDIEVLYKKKQWRIWEEGG